jgi:hypothetical protein
MRATSLDSAQLFPDESFELVFLDARHDFFAVQDVR